MSEDYKMELILQIINNRLLKEQHFVFQWECVNTIDGSVGFMVFNATFNNISVMSWRSVLLAEETGVPGENHRPVASY
jgi:hypothetical protein